MKTPFRDCIWEAHLKQSKAYAIKPHTCTSKVGNNGNTDVFFFFFFFSLFMSFQMYCLLDLFNLGDFDPKVRTSLKTIF